MRQANYDKFPSTKLTGTLIQGWQSILSLLQEKRTSHVLAVELYTGVYEEEVLSAFSADYEGEIIDTRDLMKPENEIITMTERFMTDDVLFGYVTNLTLKDYFDMPLLEQARRQAQESKTSVVVIGTGASFVVPDDAMVVYIDMARWEIQQRFRRHEVKALGIDNRSDAVSIQYKRGYFNDWRICDKHKDQLFSRVAYWIDTHTPSAPKMIDRTTFFQGIEVTAATPFRVVPFFDPAPWGGQWMKEVCDLDHDRENFGWCFDCVPEENSLYLEVNGTRFELPSVDLILLKSKEILGEALAGKLPEINAHLAASGSTRSYKNLLGLTLGTGFGAGVVINNHLLTGDNGCGGDVWIMRNKKYPEMIAEESVSIRAVKRVYQELSKTDSTSKTPKDIFEIAEGKMLGDKQAARESFHELGEMVGHAIVNALNIVDGLVVIGGGVAGASKYILPGVMDEIKRPASTFAGASFPSLQMEVFNLEEEEGMTAFLEEKDTTVLVPHSEQSVPYVNHKKIGIAISTLGTNEAVALGAYSFALAQLDL